MANNIVFSDHTDREILMWVATRLSDCGTDIARLDHKIDGFVNEYKDELKGEIRPRIRDLERKWYQVLGIVAGVSGIGGFVGGVISNLLT